jgi:hypothetical protein
MSEAGSELYYMAPMANAPLIALIGILSYNCVQSNPSLPSVSIADPFVNNRRHRIVVAGRPLHDYVPLYWATHTPMQYVITVSAGRLRQEDLVFFVIDAQAVFELDGVLSTDGNAASNESQFFEGDGAMPHLDWQIIRTRNCYSKEYKRRKCAEVLVPEHVPVTCIRRISVFDEVAALRLQRSVEETAKGLGEKRRRSWKIAPAPRLYYFGIGITAG